MFKKSVTEFVCFGLFSILSPLFYFCLLFSCHGAEVFFLWWSYGLSLKTCSDRLLFLNAAKVCSCGPLCKSAALHSFTLALQIEQVVTVVFTWFWWSLRTTTHQFTWPFFSAEYSLFFWLVLPNFIALDCQVFFDCLALWSPLLSSSLSSLFHHYNHWRSSDVRTCRKKRCLKRFHVKKDWKSVTVVY